MRIKVCVGDSAGYWECPKLSSYWNVIHKILCKVFQIHIPMNMQTLYFWPRCVSDTKEGYKAAAGLL